MPRPIHLLLLRCYAQLPRRLRRLLLGWGAPSFTVGAICVVRRDDGRVLLVRHSYRERWGFPGGLLARNEEPRAGAVREAREEVGLPIVVIGEPTVVVAPKARRVDVVFACEPADGADPDAVAPTSAEILEARWFPRDELPELQHEAAGGLAALESAQRGRAGGA